MENNFIVKLRPEKRRIECPSLCGVQIEEKKMLYKKQPLKNNSFFPKNSKKRSLKRSSPPEHNDFNEGSTQTLPKFQLTSSQVIGSTNPPSASPTCCQYSPRNHHPVSYSIQILPPVERKLFLNGLQLIQSTNQIKYYPLLKRQKKLDRSLTGEQKQIKTRSLKEIQVPYFNPNTVGGEKKQKLVSKMSIGKIQQFQIKEVVSEGQDEQTEDQFSEVVRSPYFSIVSHSPKLTKIY